MFLDISHFDKNIFGQKITNYRGGGVDEVRDKS